MRTRDYNPVSRPVRDIEDLSLLNFEQNTNQLFLNNEAVELSDAFYTEYGYKVPSYIFSKIAETVLYTSYFFFDYKNYDQVVENLAKDIYNLEYMNSLAIAFIMELGVIPLPINHNKKEMVTKYDSSVELQNDTIVNLVSYIANFIKEKDIKFNS